MRSVLLFALLAPILSAQSTSEVRRSIELALHPLQQSAAGFVSKRACVSCHHNILPVLLLHSARERGVAIDSAVLAAVESKTFRSLQSPNAFDDAVQAVTFNDPTPDDSYLLMAAHAAGVPPDLTTAVYARRLAQLQREGHWVTSDFRPPHSSSNFTATATAVRAINFYMPPELRAERDACNLRARSWLSHEKPASTEDAAFRLMGLVWAAGSSTEVAAATRDLLALRKPSGGWPELPGYQPDGYSTGESLFALREAGMPSADALWRAGEKFLLSTQAGDGTWRVPTRMLSPASVSPEYFATGFPYGKDEFLSYAGSAWATMALLTTLPATHQVDKNESALPQTWQRTALFGTAKQLTALLDSGLDPNSKTEKGTTLLMMAATDAEKVRILVSHGADPKSRAASGVDAVTIAAASRNTAPAIQELLTAGAEANVPEGVRSKNSPLLLASMTGDLDNVKLLLAHGANTSTGLAEAVTFGYSDVVSVLIAAGAPARLTESSGINLLHWAVIANRPAIIPALIAAGVPIDAQDEHDYTPLMYAATIDFGDTASLKALLKAGADPKIPNDAGRTALEQAHYCGHVNLESVVRNHTHQGTRH
jgi:ankyrin repeat protein